MDKYVPSFGSPAREGPPTWQFRWPNAADLNFNYYRLLAEARESGIGRNVKPDLRIAIVGAGVAGLTAARELFRSGYTNIDIFEASDRIGGRTWSIPAPDRNTTFEMGAMRMPFFDGPGSQNEEDEPPTPELAKVYRQWLHFAKLVIEVCQEKYGMPEWPDFWQKIATHYWTMNFRELAYLKAIDQYDPAKPGYFGGLGMNESEANLFYTIGAGDGSWGSY